ncbi:protein FAR1-RELATED SEQUENCE 3-like [Humulus lupulus]|uniref:protein FAR1-RELATED SEQUENCE 3-like n=1 Tax=Humulus lupulus TaxID=3486 RepID=UPI002B40D45F|nr:protein FAR1-RELATED SEQUENCE 3-like [Humulus lupulus]
MEDIPSTSDPEWENIAAQLNIAIPINEIETSDVLGKLLNSVEKWEEFYKLSAKWTGFSIRRDDVKRVQGHITMRRWVCSYEGYRRESSSERPRKKRPHPLMRTGCQVALRVVRVAGAKREEKIKTDSERALGFLDCLSKKDPNFFVVYQVDEDNCLANLLWPDGTSHLDYVAFRDVLGFDTTYMTNEYNKPLTVMAGVNHHFHTYIFGFALLLHEKQVSYSWLLRVFL